MDTWIFKPHTSLRINYETGFSFIVGKNDIKNSGIAHLLICEKIFWPILGVKQPIEVLRIDR